MPLKIAKINQQTNKIVAVTTTCNHLLTRAQKLAQKLDFPLLDHEENKDQFQFLLALTPEHLELRENTKNTTRPIWIDFLSPKITYRIKHGGGKKQLIAKATGINKEKNLKILDATAGFGIDAFVLASLGAEVTMIERSPIIGALLEDGLNRFKTNPKSQNIKIKLLLGEAFTIINKIIKNNLKRPDVIYLDPMYPERKKSALNKKTMRILHDLVGDDIDASKLLKIAIKCAKKRVVVKRPKHANCLGDLKPNFQLSSDGSSRYDVYSIHT